MWRVIFKFYGIYTNIKTLFKLRYYKFLWKYQLHVHADFNFDVNSFLDIQSGNSQVWIGKGVHFRKFCNIICSEYGKLRIGNHVFFNNYSSINCLSDITIGDNCIFGEGVRLYDHNHEYKDDTAILSQGYKLGIIVIGNNCWVGSNTIILPNVTIGDNVVIGANNIIFKSIPSNTIVKAKVDYHIHSLS